MITAREIKTFSEKLGVPARTIDKDWVLGHLLAGIFDNAYFQDNLIFKGGTCLKKCYFENYRFSEDLDFTSINVEKKKIVSNFKKVIQEIDSETGILFGKIKVADKKFKDNLVAYECSIPFWGADHPKNKQPPPETRWMSSIKIDFTIHEVICLEKEKKKIIHPLNYYFVCKRKLCLFTLRLSSGFHEIAMKFSNILTFLYRSFLLFITKHGTSFL